MAHLSVAGSELNDTLLVFNDTLLVFTDYGPTYLRTLWNCLYDAGEGAVDAGCTKG